MHRKVISYILIILSLFFTFNLARGVYDSYKNKSKLQEVHEQLPEAQSQNKQLKKDLDYKQSEFFVEKEARDKLNLAKKDEVVAIFPQLGTREQASSKRDKPLKNWRKWQKLLLN